MPPEEGLDPNPSQRDTENQSGTPSGFPDITLESLVISLLLLGLILFLINALMVYLFMTQDWPMRYPLLAFAKIGAALMLFGGALFLANRFLEKKKML